jgi:hypothetical protein
MSEDAELEWPLAGVRVLTPRNKTPDGQVLLPFDLEEVLSTMGPLGGTPLYFAVEKVIREDKNLKAASPRRLIVLTDGENQDSDPIKTKEEEVLKQKGQPVTARQRVTPEDVVAAMNSSDGQGVQLHVIGFGQAAQGEREWMNTILPEIKPRSRGRYYDVKLIRDLDDKIRDALDLKRYAVYAAGSSQPLGQLNPELVLKNHRGVAEYQVKMEGSNHSSDLRLEGGEAIDLYPDENDSSRLVHRLYNVNEQVDSIASRAGSLPEKRRIGFQWTQPKPGALEFPISIQNIEATLFTERPAEAWVEITPIEGGAPNTKKTMLFYDLEFAEGRPVPVLLCRARGWTGADRAQIDLFFKMRPTDPIRRRVNEVERTGRSSDFDVRTSGGRVRFTVQVAAAEEYNGSRVRVTELCEREADLRQAKVQMDPPANIVRRQYIYSTERPKVEHEFIYRDKRPEEVRQDCFVTVTSKKDLEDGAFHLEKPVEIAVDP